METLRRVIHPETRIVDAKKGLVDYVASDETIDSFKEIIRAAGWRFTNFAKNSPFVDSHDTSTVAKLLGRVIDFRVASGQLVERVQWAVDVAENELAQLGFRMTEAGYLKAVSVGFFPVQYLTPNSGQAWTDALTEMRLPGDAEVRTIYTVQEQVELSACVLGANPNALAKARSDGLILDSHLEKFPALVRRMERGNGRAFSFPTATATKSASSKDEFMKKIEILTRHSGIQTPKAAFDNLEMTRRDGTDDEIQRAVMQARVAVSAECRNGGPDPVERFLDQPGIREFFNALARRITNQPYPDDFKPILKDLDVTPGGTGAAFFLPQALSDQLFDLLPLYGAFNFLGVRKLPKMFTKFPQVTGLPSAIFINATQGNVAVPKDTAFVGTQLLPEANVAASLLPVSLQVYEDAGVDLASVLAECLIRGLSARIDWAAFQGNGIVDAAGLNGGQIGLMVDATINTSVAAAGNTTVEQLDRSDFLNVLQTIAPAAMQRLCRWFINPAFIPVLLKIAEGNGANWLLKTPAESSDQTWSLVGFPVTWASQMPSVDGPGQKFAAFLNPDSYLVAISDQFQIGFSDHFAWNTLQKVFRAFTRVWCQTRAASGIATLTTAAQ
jgi:HK97 family phage major capsid protein